MSYFDDRELGIFNMHCHIDSKTHRTAFDISASKGWISELPMSVQPFLKQAECVLGTPTASHPRTLTIVLVIILYPYPGMLIN